MAEYRLDDKTIRNLGRAIIEQAMKDLTSDAVNSKNAKTRNDAIRERDDVLAWIGTDEFESVCAWAEMCPRMTADEFRSAALMSTHKRTEGAA